MAVPTDRHVCHSSEFQNSKICFSHPRPKSLEGGCIEHVMAEPRRLRLLPSSNLASAGAKDVVISVPDDSLGTRVARDALVLGPHRPLNQATPSVASVGPSVVSASQRQTPQEPQLPESSRLAPGVHKRWPGGLEPEMEGRLEAPQRGSSRAIYSFKASGVNRTTCHHQGFFQ